MADFIQALDPSKLVLAGTTLSFVTSAFHAPVYNLPIFLFGMLAQESQDAIQSLRAFTMLLTGSVVYDIIWMSRNSQNWFVKLVTILILIVKLPTALAFATALQQRGSSFPGLGIRGNDLSGPTVWSMPGGFTSNFGGRDGYQNVDEPAPGPKPLSVPPSQPQPPSAPPQAPPQAPGAYQNV
ncbi:uncharacterized protein BXZ73DRAFT_96871 [Epithele typhae]|uniref:uncharacterized protein n=1 Tax=Epithele typhae TaxID=378194 RepID=UPI00200720BB|nr:uncharacterized protein BXZ73DRAFT_96871 [Epithele typhae]KAH9944383.1 hypothetical protein BXZ73DRAFT_96871 [Epithele typhae]